MRALLAGLVLGALLHVPAHAQGPVGSKAPELEVKEFLGSKMKSMKELRGQLVLLKYFAHW